MNQVAIGGMFCGRMGPKSNFLVEVRSLPKPKHGIQAQEPHPSSHGSASIMVWGCVAASGSGRLAIIDGTMTGLYLQILQNNIRVSVHKLKLNSKTMPLNTQVSQQ